MQRPTPQTLLRTFLYGGGATLLVFELFFLLRALIASNFIPILPTVASMLTTAGLLLVIYAEYHAREQDKRDQRRISRVAHQLESPLNSLTEDLARLTRDAKSMPAEARLLLKRMETKTKILLENVRDVFLMLQAQEEGPAKEVRSYNICTLVAHAVEAIQPQAAARNVEVVYAAHCQDAPVKVDRGLFLIALSHLLENAILYTMTPGLVNIAVMKNAERVRVVVQDRGVGVSEKDAEVIFQPFARGANAHRYDADGIGVGLTLSQLIVKKFGGNLQWRSRKNTMGTEFEITLPLVPKRK